MVYHDMLDDHYLQSSSHPTCRKCERGFKDKVSLIEVLPIHPYLSVTTEPILEQHDRLAHPKLQCVPCEREFETEDALKNHYLASLNHPECVICHRGLKDDQEYRSVSIYCIFCLLEFFLAHICAQHMDAHSSLLHVQPDFDDYGSDHVFSPLSFPARRLQASRSFYVSTGHRTDRLQELNPSGPGSDEAPLSPTITLPTKYASPLMEVQTPFFHSSSLPPPGKGVEQAWAAHEVRDGRLCSFHPSEFEFYHYTPE